MNNRYCDYAYGIDTGRYNLEGIRQYVKVWHAMALAERLHMRSGYPVRILDIGCGYMDVEAGLMQSSIPHEYTGVDIRLHAFRGVVNVNSFIMADLTTERLSDCVRGRFYDLIVMNDFLQNVDTTAGLQVLGDAAGHLAPGGILTICTRNGAFEPDTDAGHHLHRWGLNALGMTLRGLGYETIDTFGINYGSDESAIEPETATDRLFPLRLTRAIGRTNKPQDCKYVIVDCNLSI